MTLEELKILEQKHLKFKADLEASVQKTIKLICDNPDYIKTSGAKQKIKYMIEGLVKAAKDNGASGALIDLRISEYDI